MCPLHETLTSHIGFISFLKKRKERNKTEQESEASETEEEMKKTAQHLNRHTISHASAIRKLCLV
jgi:hypothetical protein